MNMRGRVSEAARLRHPQAPPTVQWQSGEGRPPQLRCGPAAHPVIQIGMMLFCSLSCAVQPKHFISGGSCTWLLM